MAILRQIITLTQQQYEQLLENGSITVNNKTYTYNQDTLYVVPENNPDIKYGTKEFWTSLTDYIPKEGEMIVVSNKSTKVENGKLKTIPGIKIGDGFNNIIDLPFVEAELPADIDLSNIIPKKLAHSITFGANEQYTFDGSKDVIVPVYPGLFY